MRLALVCACAGAAWGGWLGARHLAGAASALDRLEALTLDLRSELAGPRAAPDELVIVAIDEASVAAAGRYPLPRATLAQLVERIAAAGPRVIALDLLLVDPGPEADDAALATALGRAPGILAAAATSFAPPAAAAALPQAHDLLLPLPALRAVAHPAHVNLATDAGGTPRHVPLLLALPGGVLPSLVLAAAGSGAAAVGFDADHLRLDGRPVPLDLGGQLALHFYGPRGSVRTIGAQQVLHDPAVAASLAGRVVLVGATVIGSGDRFPTPFDAALPGIEVLATGVGNLLAGDALRRTQAVRRVDAAAAIVLPVLAVGASALPGFASGLLAAGALLAGWCLAAYVALAGAGVWLAVALPLASALPALTLHATGRVWLERRERQRLERARDALGRLQSPLVATRLAADPEFLAEPVEQCASVVFVDLAGFTGLSERLGPARTHAALRAFHGLVHREATARGGFVATFMGDGAMIVFGFPDPAPDDAARALALAQALIGALGDWLATVAPAELPAAALGSRCGVHAGTVVFSRLGSDQQEHITASGDTVNVASRLMEIAKARGAQIAASEAVCTQAGPQALTGTGLHWSAAEQLPVRGRREALGVRFAFADGDVGEGTE